MKSNKNRRKGRQENFPTQIAFGKLKIGGGA